MKAEKPIKIGTLVTCANESEVWMVVEIKDRFAVVQNFPDTYKGAPSFRRVALNKLHRVK